MPDNDNEMLLASGQGLNRPLPGKGQQPVNFMRPWNRRENIPNACLLQVAVRWLIVQAEMVE